MFTGIIEATGEVKRIEKEGTNVHFTLSCPFTQELKIDQSLAHNGCCLTVVKISGEEYTVTAINETLEKTNLGNLEIGSLVNLERCMIMNGRLDGHIVQGHVDKTGELVSVENINGSYFLTFKYEEDGAFTTVQQGSITVYGISLMFLVCVYVLFCVAVNAYGGE